MVALYIRIMKNWAFLAKNITLNVASSSFHNSLGVLQVYYYKFLLQVLSLVQLIFELYLSW